MRRIDIIDPAFVEEIPQDLKLGKLYVSIPYGTATHSCCCGCGAEVVTPIHPTGWTLIYDGDTVSLDPSVGSWDLPCRSHYVIRKNRIHWAVTWSKAEIEAGRARDARVVDEYFSQDDGTGNNVAAEVSPSRLERLWRRLRPRGRGGR